MSTQYRRGLRVALLILIAALAGCASTSLDNTWRDPQYAGGPLHKILVVGVSNQSASRRIFEDTFSQELIQRGTQAIPGYTLIPQDGQIPEDVLQKAVKESGVDGVLITRMVGKDRDVTVAPAGPMPPPMWGMRPYYYGFYSGAWVGYYDPGMVMTTDYIVAETTLFRADSPESIWSATTSTLQPTDVRKSSEGFASVMIAALKKAGMI